MEKKLQTENTFMLSFIYTYVMTYTRTQIFHVDLSHSQMSFYLFASDQVFQCLFIWECLKLLFHI